MLKLTDRSPGAQTELEDALKRIRLDNTVMVRVEEGEYWDRIPAWGANAFSMARIVADIAIRHPGIVVTAISSSDCRFPIDRPGLVIKLWPAGYLCYTDDELAFETGWSGQFPEHLRDRVAVTVGDDVRRAFELLMPRLDALREWGEEVVRLRAAEAAAHRAERAARIADGRALGEHLASLIMSGDALALADAVNKAVGGMARGGIGRATSEVEHIAFMRMMSGRNPLGFGGMIDPPWSMPTECATAHHED